MLGPWEFPFCCVIPHTRPAPLSDSLPLLLSGGFWQTGKAQKEYQTPQSCSVQHVDGFRVGTVVPTSIRLSQMFAWTDSRVSSVPPWLLLLPGYMKKSSHLCKRTMKVLQILLFLLDFSFPDLVWNTKGSCSYFSICPLPKIPRSSRGHQAGVLNGHNGCAPSPCDDSGQD